MSYVSDFITRAEEAAAAEAVKRKESCLKQVAALRPFLETLIEPLKADGATVDELVYGTDNDGKRVSYLEAKITVPGLLPFWIVAKPWRDNEADVAYQTYSEGKRDHLYNNSVRVNAMDHAGIGKLFINRREGYQKAEAERQEKQAEERKKEAANLVRRLENWRQSGFPETSEQAQTMIAEVAELSDAYDLVKLRAEWQQQLQAMREFRVKQDADRQAEIERKRLYDEKLAEFKATWKKYTAERERLWNINRERFPALQEKYNEVFEVYELCYAVYVPALDEDGPYIEKESCDCLWPYQNGFHREIGRNGGIKPYRYSDAHVYKIGQERKVQPVSYKSAGRYSLLDQLGEDVALRYVPGTDPEEIAAAVARTFEPVPAEPQPDPLLNYNDVRRIQQGKEPEDELLF